MATYASFEQYRNESPFAAAGPAFPPGGVMRNV